MKIIIRILAYVLIIFHGTLAIANDHDQDAAIVSKSEQLVKIVYHLNEREKSRMLVESVTELLNASGEIDIKVVIHGIAIIRLAKNDDMSKEFANLIERGVEIGACSNSILRRRVDPSTMIDGVELITEGGVKRLLTLQQRGYLYIKI
ncbi:MAG: DsrE family protein [Cellvibrionaceae bacterium]